MHGSNQFFTVHFRKTSKIILMAWSLAVALQERVDVGLHGLCNLAFPQRLRRWQRLFDFLTDLQSYPLLLIIALEGGDTLCTRRFPVQCRCVMRSIFCLSSRQFYCLSSRGHFIRLVDSFRYNGLATLALAGPSGPRAGPSGPLRALRARNALKTGGVGGILPPLKMVGM